MILSETYSREWIGSFRGQAKYKKIDPALLEKMIHALALAEKLALQNFELIFKGGTCLLLLLSEPSRFSIDVDITTPVERGELGKILDRVVSESHFSSWTLDRRKNKTGIPKEHYVFEFKSMFNRGSNNILLDVIFDEIPHSKTIEASMLSQWLKTGEPIHSVRIPSSEALLGDKLTAFAPNTIGVPYGVNKDIEIIKQLFDIDCLLDQSTDMETIKNTYDAVAAKQFNYLNLNLSTDSVLHDSIDTALILARRNNNTGEDAEKYQELLGGISKFNNYLISGNFRIEQAQAAAARAACLAGKLLVGDYSEPAVFKTGMDLSNFEIKNREFSFLNRFKKTNREAFFYWHQYLYVKRLL
jgi:hypothetical protein